MANTSRFNTSLFNGRDAGAVLRETDTLIFNGFWLQNQYFITTDVNVWNMPNINLLTYSNPKSDWGGLLDRYYKERTITVKGHINWSTNEEIEDRIDSLKKAISVKQWYLEFKFWERYRRILCTLTNSNVVSRANYEVSHWQFELSFKAEKPFWSEKEPYSQLIENVNDEINEDIFNEWSQYTRPKINFVFNQASWVNDIKLTIWNDTLSITETISRGDILNIDTELKTITLNWTWIDFEWRFPRLEAGVNTLNVVVNGTYNCDISILFPKNFL